MPARVFDKCTMENCEEKHCAKGLCRKHYLQEYFRSEKGKEARNKYSKSEKGREAHREAKKKYRKSEKGKDVLSSLRHRYRTRKFNNEYQNFSPLDIFERDNWTCQICGEEIFSELKYPHHFSASIDHVVPLSKGGVHSPENVQAAHLICNIRKGNRVD